MTAVEGRIDVVAVGGGPDALAAAIVLARAGRSVLVVGESGHPGGVAANCEIRPGFQLPVAPETLPSLDPDSVARLGLADHGIEFVAPEAALTVVGRNGAPPFTLPRDPEAATRAVARISAKDGGRFPEFAAELGAYAGFLRRLIPHPPLAFDASVTDAAPAALGALELGGRRIPRLLAALPTALRDYLDDRFESEALKAALAGPALTGIRLPPRAPGTAGLFLHFHAFGHPAPLGFLLPPRGGSTAVGAALRAAAREAGARLGSDSGGVRRIRVEHGPAGARAVGVELADGRALRAGAILSDAAPRTTFLDWVGAPQLTPEFVRDVAHIRYRGVAARVGFALAGLPRFPDGPGGGGFDPRLAGIIQVGASLDDLERAADAAKYGRLAEDPVIFAFLPSLHHDGLAPRGRHVLAATAQAVPYALADGTPPADDDVLEIATRSLEIAFPGFRRLVLGARVLTPPTLERGFGLVEGSFHQGEPALDQLYSLRPVPGHADYRTPVAGLYLAGPATSPYGGLHLVSGRNAAEAVLADGS